MTAGARTPEELDALLEDAILLHDRRALGALFDDGAVLAPGRGTEARGADAIVHAVAALWAGGGTCVARPRRVLQARDTALVVSDSGIHVLRRGSDRAWRAAISLLHLDHPVRQEEP